MQYESLQSAAEVLSDVHMCRGTRAAMSDDDVLSCYLLSSSVTHIVDFHMESFKLERCNRSCNDHAQPAADKAPTSVTAALRTHS